VFSGLTTAASKLPFGCSLCSPVLCSALTHRKRLTIDKLSRNFVGGILVGLDEPMHRKPLTIDEIRLRKFY
jgi:hypothetical protein